MHGDVWRGRDRHGGQAECLDGVPDPGGVARHDERTGWKRDRSLFEPLLRGLHLQVLQTIAQRDHVVRTVMRDGEHRSVSGRCPGQMNLRLIHRIDRQVQDFLVRDFLHLRVTHEPHCPRRIVVRAQIGIGVDLPFEQRLHETAVRLIAFDDERSGWESPLLQPDFDRGAADFDALEAQEIHQALHPRHVALPGRDDVTGDRLLAAGLGGVPRFHVEVLEDDRRELRRVLERGENAGFTVICVVAERPVELAGRRPGPIPLPLRLVAPPAGRGRFVASGAGSPWTRRASTWPGAGLRIARRRQPQFLRVRAAESLNLVHPDHPVVVRRHERQVAGRPHIDEAVRPHARHAVLRELRHLEIGHHRQFAVQNRIEVRILRCLTAERVQQRLGLMQVVHDRRMPLEVPLQQRSHLNLRVIDVAVVVVEHVLAPVRHARACRPRLGLVDAVPVVPVDIAVASIRIGDRRDRHDDALADLIDDRRILGGEPIGQFHQHLRRSHLAAVETADQVIDRFRAGNDLRGSIGRDRSRIGELSQGDPVRVKIPDRFVRAHEHDDELASFVASADRRDVDAGRRVGEGAVVPQDVGVVGQLSRLADVMAEDVLRRRNARSLGQVIDERAHELGPGRPLPDRAGEVGIV